MDKLTIMGNLPIYDEIFLQELIDKHSHITVSKAMTSYVVGQFFSSSENGFYFEYDGLNSKAMNKRNFKIEFNPSKVSEEQKEFLRTEVLILLNDVGFSRLDLAIDIRRDLSLFTFEIFNRKRTKIFSKTSELETMYIGSRNSRIMQRIYDKKRQLKDVEDVDLEEPVLWRLEFEIKHYEIIDNLIEFGFENIIENRIIKYDYEGLSAVDVIMIKSMEEFPEDFSRLSKNTKTKIRKNAKDLKGYDISEEIKSAIKEKNHSILRELNGYRK